MRTSNWLSSMAVVACAALLLRATACLDPGVCIRNSDCSNSFICVEGACVPPPVDGGDAAAIDDASAESSADGSETSIDAAIDASDASDSGSGADGDAADGDPSFDASDSG